MLEAIEILPKTHPRALMIWLHGLGASGYDLEPVAQMLDIDEIHHVLPHAPIRPVTINGGLVMRAWYDIAGPDLLKLEDVAGMQASARVVKSMAQRWQNEKGLPIVLAGFSQGAVISLATMALGMKVLGVAVLSGYLPAYLSSVPRQLASAPVFMAHGRQDPVIPFEQAKAASETLSRAGVALSWHVYDMPHTICAEEIDALRLEVRCWLATGPRPDI